jgi:hypothetical protein
MFAEDGVRGILLLTNPSGSPTCFAYIIHFTCLDTDYWLAYATNNR